MGDKIYVRGHFGVKKGTQASGKPKVYPRDKRKCDDCMNSRINSQGQLICLQYFDYVPRPFNCEEEGKFTPR